MKDPVRVLLVDDSFLIRSGLEQMLGLSDAVDVIGTSADPAAAWRAMGEQLPDVVLLSRESHVELASSLLERGASGRGYLLKDRVHDLHHLVDTIVTVAAGECRVDPTLITMLVQRPVGRASPWTRSPHDNRRSWPTSPRG